MGMSLRKYAAHRGVSLAAVQKAISSGRIQKEADGKINPDTADAAWDANTHPVHKNPVLQGAGDSVDVSYHRARAIKEQYAARITKLEFEAKSGKLIDKDETASKVFNMANTAKMRLEQIPRRVAPLLVGQTNARDIEDMLAAAIREALTELSTPQVSGVLH